MQILFGKRIADGVAVGLARFIEPLIISLPTHSLTEDQVEGELNSLDLALKAVEQDLNVLLEPKLVNQNEREILETHVQILQDPELYGYMTDAIKAKLFPAAKAVNEVFTYAINVFENIENELFRQRAADYKDVRDKLIKKILNDQSDRFADISEDHIPIMKEIDPSQASLLQRKHVRAIIVDSCSPTSHAAIICRALGIGLVSGVENLRNVAQNGECLIVDAEVGKVVVEPENEMLEYYAQRLQVEEMIRQKQLSQKRIPCQTKDGRRILLKANLGVSEELDAIADLGSDGIGLYRTEYLFISKDTLPDEESQLADYRNVLEKMAPNPVTIRTFDLGGDKLSHLISSLEEANPYLGNRGIRFSLSHPDLFKTQLRAILRASAFGKVQIMFPMIIDTQDFLEAKRLYNICKDELYAEGHEYDPDIPLGCMVEIPAAAICSDSLAKECDFLSIGTNDLAQYTLAVDRNGENVARYYIQHHPAVLKLILFTLSNAANHQTPVSLCGEMASIKEYVPLLIGMGITELSVNHAAYYQVKNIVQKCDAKLQNTIKLFTMDSPLVKVEELIYQTLKPYYSGNGR
ncbi:MAG: phosphoenolpyruvate--protein phosphotransferase [Candidatus Cloacimonetes bacterium]|nr:phosphoenolpyruvate--protein phosphotransferase [Candidatus Cloacimonadota bacterium]